MYYLPNYGNNPIKLFWISPTFVIFDCNGSMVGLYWIGPW